MIPVVFSVITKPPLGNGYVYEGFADALECAMMFSGQEVCVLSDAPLKVRSGVTLIQADLLSTHDFVKPFLLAANNARQAGVGLFQLDIPSALRWHYLRRAIETGLLPERVFFIDWDVLIFSNIEQACLPFAAYDLLCADMHPGKVSQNPCGMFSLPALQDMTGLVLQKARLAEIALDMGCWTEIYNTGKYKVADVGKEHLDSTTVFDGNLGDLEDSEFLDDGNGYKLIEWKNHLPYFVSKKGWLVRAHCLHCWGEYKLRTRELLNKAGL